MLLILKRDKWLHLNIHNSFVSWLYEYMVLWFLESNAVLLILVMFFYVEGKTKCLNLYSTFPGQEPPCPLWWSMTADVSAKGGRCCLTEAEGTASFPSADTAPVSVTLGSGLKSWKQAVLLRPAVYPSNSWFFHPFPPHFEQTLPWEMGVRRQKLSMHTYCLCPVQAMALRRQNQRALVTSSWKSFSHWKCSISSLFFNFFFSFCNHSFKNPASAPLRVRMRNLKPLSQLDLWCLA